MYLDLDLPERNYRKPSVAQGQISLEISELRDFLHRQTCMRDLDLQQWVRVCRRNLKKQPPASLLLSSSLSRIRPELVYASPANQKTKGQNTQRCMSVSLDRYKLQSIDDGCFFFLKNLQAPATISLQSDRRRLLFFSLAPTAHNNFATVQPMLAVFFFPLEHPPPTIYTRVLRSEDL